MAPSYFHLIDFYFRQVENVLPHGAKHASQGEALQGWGWRGLVNSVAALHVTRLSPRASCRPSTRAEGYWLQLWEARRKPAFCTVLIQTSDCDYTIWCCIVYVSTGAGLHIYAFLLVVTFGNVLHLHLQKLSPKTFSKFLLQDHWKYQLWWSALPRANDLLWKSFSCRYTYKRIYSSLKT